MVARPGTQVVMRSAPIPKGAPTDTGVAFFAGITQVGRTDKAVLLHSMSDYTKYFGQRVSYGVLYDACDAAFQSGCTKVYAGRVVGPAATKDTLAISDAVPAPSIAVDSIGAGASGLSASVVAGVQDATARILNIIDTASGKVLESSPELKLPSDFANWSTTNSYRVVVRAVGAGVPAVTAVTPLAGGNDDRAAITDTVKDTAMRALFPKALGPGQVAYPGATTDVAHTNLVNFAQDTNRFALLDLTDVSSAATLESAVVAVQSDNNAEVLSETFGLFLAPWHVIAGVTNGTTRTVPPSAIAAGLIAKSDAKTGNVNVPAAGANGVSSITLALSQPAWSDDDRTALNEAGVAIFRDVYGNIELFGYRTGAKQDDNASKAWDSAGAARLRMAITNDLEIIGTQYLFNQIDGQGHTIASFTGAIIGKLQQYWSLGALYGATPSDAFVVDTGPTVNTPDTIAAKELHALIGIKDSPFNEFSYFEVTKADVNQQL